MLQRAATAKSSCWTCKARRVGCDKALPRCANCIRSGRECLGYGIRLKWPETRDGRRREDETQLQAPAPRNPSDQSGSRDYGIYFLNVTNGDVSYANSAGLPRLIRDMAAAPTTPLRPPRALTSHPDMHQDAMLLSYYESIISPMVSTLRIQNGFRSELIPMVMSGSDAAATALCSAMMAVSAVHQQGAQAALPYKAKAIRSLSESLSAPKPSGQPPDMTVVQAAAAMMLCVYSVFDDKDGNWHTHLDGAKFLVNMLCRSRAIRSDFVMTWFIYHEVMGGFTQPARQLPAMLSPRASLKNIGFDFSQIVGSVGCSMEIFDIIDQINRLRALSIHESSDKTALSLEGSAQLGVQLQDLEQKLHPAEAESITPTRRIEILVTAELYRIAAQMYLHRVCASNDDNERTAVLLERAFDALAQLAVPTSPWPVFIIACESRTDAHRIKVLRVIDIMSETRKIGNLTTMRTAIENYWKQHDLQADTAVERATPWWNMFSNDKPVPWFV